MRSPSSYTTGSEDIGSAMTPMIDVVFQLLIYFLCTTSFALPEQLLPTTLPPAGSSTYQPTPEVQELELIRIALRQDDQQLAITLNGNPTSSLDELRQRLQQLLALTQLPAVLDISPEVELAHVVGVYDTCLTVGLRDIHFAAPDR